MVGSWGLSWKAARRPLERDIHTRYSSVGEFPPAYLLLVTYRYRRSSECPVPECAKCEIREIKVQTRTKPKYVANSQFPIQLAIYLCGVRAMESAPDAGMRTGVRVVVLVCRASFCIVQNASRFTGPTPATIALQKHPRRQLRAG